MYQGGNVGTAGGWKEVIGGSNNTCKLHMTSYLAKKRNSEISELHKGREDLW
jgi:hypothetical protein